MAPNKNDRVAIINNFPILFSTVWQGVILQRSARGVGIPHGFCSGDHRFLFPYLRVLLQSQAGLSLWGNHLLSHLPPLRVYLHPRGGWLRQRKGARENRRQSPLYLCVRTGSEVFCDL